MEKSRVGSGQCPHLLRVHSQFTEQHSQDEGARIVIRAIALGKIRNAEHGMLENSGRIGHAREMAQLQLRQFPRFLVEHLGGQRFSRALRPFNPRQLKGAHVHLRHVAPDHLPAEPVGVFAHGMTAGIVMQQANHFARYSRGVGERD